MLPEILASRHDEIVIDQVTFKNALILWTDRPFTTMNLSEERVEQFRETLEDCGLAPRLVYGEMMPRPLKMKYAGSYRYGYVVMADGLNVKEKVFIDWGTKPLEVKPRKAKKAK